MFIEIPEGWPSYCLLTLLVLSYNTQASALFSLRFSKQNASMPMKKRTNFAGVDIGIFILLSSAVSTLRRSEKKISKVWRNFSFRY